MKPHKKRKTKRRKPARKPVEKLSPGRKRLFTLLLVLIPLGFLVLLETGLRIFKYGGEHAFFVSTPDADSPYYGVNVDAGKRYFHRSGFKPTPRKDLFLKEKPEDCFRIFVLGGSTTAGFPYGNNLTFPRILNRRLSDTFADRHIEVINTAMTAVSSYTLLDILDEILSYQPDGLLIYAGHNEYYGALGVGSMESLGRFRPAIRLYLYLQRFRTFLLMRDAISRIGQSIRRAPQEDPGADPMETEMSRIVRDQNIPYRSRVYEQGKAQYRENLRAILNKARNAGVPVLLSELVSNVRDQRPFVSVPADTFPPAAEVFETGRRLERLGEFEQARERYYRSKDLDALRFRAPEAFNAIVHALSDEFAVPVVPMQSCFESASPRGLVGNSLMSEHLHPNKTGYFLMADAFYETLRREKWIEEDWETPTAKPASAYPSDWGFTALDSVYAGLTVRHLKGGWPFKKSGPNRALQEFRPVSVQDSIALAILRDRSLTLELGHIRLAHHYRLRGETERAFQEFRALLYTVPHLDMFYEPALQILLETEQYARAFLLFEDGLKFNRSGFMYKWAGQLALASGNSSSGIEYLETARAILPGDIQLLYNLARAYYTIRYNPRRAMRCCP